MHKAIKISLAVGALVVAYGMGGVTQQTLNLGSLEHAKEATMKVCPNTVDPEAALKGYNDLDKPAVALACAAYWSGRKDGVHELRTAIAENPNTKTFAPLITPDAPEPSSFDPVAPALLRKR